MGIPTPGRGDAVTLTYVADRVSYGTALKVESVAFDGDRVIIKAQFLGAKPLTGIDARLDHHRQSIQGLLEHLQQHCPELLGKGECEHIGKDKS